MRRQVLRPIAEAVSGCDQRRMALLDVACGTGRLMGEISRAFPALPQTGIDLSDAYIEEARHHLRGRRGISLQTANAEQLPFDESSFDIVTTSFLFHELPPARSTDRHFRNVTCVEAWRHSDLCRLHATWRCSKVRWHAGGIPREVPRTLLPELPDR